MKYLKLFKIHSDYEEYINGEAVLPNVSYCKDERHVHYNPWTPPHDYSQDYFTMVVTVGGDVTWTGTENNALYYSKDNGNTWSEPSVNITLSVNEGDKVLWKGETRPQVFGIGAFYGSTDVRYTVEGNVMSLLFGDDFKGQTSLEDKSNAFMELFYENNNITSAEKLSLPATTLANYCYADMFRGCSNLVTAPVLPVTTLANYCYNNMFYGCISLVTAPELPATTLVEGCYNSMFRGCSNLVTAPVLPATTLADYCYYSMFSDCSSLVTAPVLPATTLAEKCYKETFRGCTSLVTAPPILPATTLADYCYAQMFSDCSNLVTAPELPATTLADRCYDNMFSDCTSLVTAPVLPATTLAEGCYSGMFQNCSSLNYIKALFTTTPSTSYTNYWVFRVSATGTFVKSSEATWTTTGVNGIPSGWTVVDA